MTRKEKLELQPNGGLAKQFFWFLTVHIYKFIALIIILSFLSSILLAWLTTEIIIKRSSKGKLYIYQINKKGADVNIKTKIK